MMPKTSCFFFWLKGKCNVEINHGEPHVPFIPKSQQQPMYGHFRLGSVSDVLFAFSLLLPVWIIGYDVSLIFKALREGRHYCPLTHSHPGSIPKCRSKAKSVCLVPVPVAGSLPTRARVPRLHLPPRCPSALLQSAHLVCRQPILGA